MAFKAFYKEDIRAALQSDEFVIDMLARFAEQEARKVAQGVQTIEDMREHLDIFKQGLICGLTGIAMNFDVDM